MKRLALISIMLLPLLLTSCVKTEYYSYPKTITFSKEGGTQTYDGNSDINNVSLTTEWAKEKDEQYWYDEDGTMTVNVQWLTVTTIGYEDQNKSTLVFVAEPNDSGRARKLYLHCYNGYASWDITVKQKK